MATKTITPDIVTPVRVPKDPKTNIADKISLAFAKYWNVIVWDDNVHTFKEVIDCLMQVLGISESEAFGHSSTIHTTGKSIVASETLEKAELYHNQIEEFGLNVTIERNS